jgi:alpha-2-macroglobulin
LEKEGKHPQELNHIAQYFLERRDKGKYTNTVESASVLSAILPWMLKNNANITANAFLSVSGDTSLMIQQFPSTVTISEKTKNLKIEKNGGGIVFVTAYQQVFNKNPQPVEDYFVVQTSFERRGSTVASLKAGEKINLKVELKVLKDVEYVQIEIPIPAGCTYGEKKQDGWNTHKEFLKNKTMIFVEKLNAGTYTYIIELEPRYSGKFHLNPAKAELMYFPTFYGRNEIKKIEIVK